MMSLMATSKLAPMHQLENSKQLVERMRETLRLTAFGDLELKDHTADFLLRRCQRRKHFITMSVKAAEGVIPQETIK